MPLRLGQPLNLLAAETRLLNELDLTMIGARFVWAVQTVVDRLVGFLFTIISLRA